MARIKEDGSRISSCHPLHNKNQRKIYNAEEQNMCKNCAISTLCHENDETSNNRDHIQRQKHKMLTIFFFRAARRGLTFLLVTAPEDS